MDYQQLNYTECTYLSKGQEICKIPFSGDIKDVIQIKVP